MKKHNFTPVFRATFVVLLFAIFGFQQSAKAQLTIVNNLQCWILVGEQEGNLCNICNTANGLWIPPVTFAPNNTAVFNHTCAIITPFQQSWIGVKYAVAPFPTPNPGNGSFTENTTNVNFPCGYNQNNSQCGFNLVNPQWAITGGNGATTVTFQ